MAEKESSQLKAENAALKLQLDEGALYSFWLSHVQAVHYI